MTKNSTYEKTINLPEKHSTFMQKEINLTSEQFNMGENIHPAFVDIIWPDIEECMMNNFCKCKLIVLGVHFCHTLRLNGKFHAI